MPGPHRTGEKGTWGEQLGSRSPWVRTHMGLSSPCVACPKGLLRPLLILIFLGSEFWVSVAARPRPHRLSGPLQDTLQLPTFPSKAFCLPEMGPVGLSCAFLLRCLHGLYLSPVP